MTLLRCLFKRENKKIWNLVLASNPSFREGSQCSFERRVIEEAQFMFIEYRKAGGLRSVQIRLDSGNEEVRTYFLL